MNVIIRKNTFPLYKETVKIKIDGWVLKSIDFTYKATRDKKDEATPLVAFLILSCAIDMIAGFYSGRTNRKSGSNKNEYFAFVSKYLHQYDPDLFYQGLRCDLSHNFTLGDQIILTHGHEELHKTYNDTGNREIWNFENLYHDFQKGLEAYFADVEKSQDLKDKFILRFEAIGIADTLGINPKK